MGSLRETQCPVAGLIPPGLEANTAPTCCEIEEACVARRLRPESYALYVGNLDTYQDVDDLAPMRPPTGD